MVYHKKVNNDLNLEIDQLNALKDKSIGLGDGKPDNQVNNNNFA